MTFVQATEVQERLYALLMSKYGKPASSNVVNLQNAMGANFQGIEAVWNMGRMQVKFIGVLGSHSEGLIVAVTPQGRAFLESRRPKAGTSF